MTRAKALAIRKQALWEQMDQLVEDGLELADRAIIGDEAYEHDAALKAEVRRIEHERDLDLYRLAVRIGRRNRGEE